ncbi:hypothetical protein ES695_00545 [Candidatus Atribacteria bacterium 1244-E10-H5-B2]|nr:MAG: hypothetical protein ES695_00545 [Candidatus Atribacteria bacterium 1244-E10-H5-B2]
MKELLIYPRKDRNDKSIPGPGRVYRDKEHAIQYAQLFGWTVKVDGTDHFTFECPQCKGPAKVIKVERNEVRADDYGNTSPCIRFWLRCLKCKTEGKRKIYLEDR